MSTFSNIMAFFKSLFSKFKSKSKSKTKAGQKVDIVTPEKIFPDWVSPQTRMLADYGLTNPHYLNALDIDRKIWMNSVTSTDKKQDDHTHFSPMVPHDHS